MARFKLLFNALWQDYSQRLCPSAVKIHHLLENDTPLLNDHIALRTFNHQKMGLVRMCAPFIALGYAPKAEYFFKAKKLYARHFEHPHPHAPKVFISELLVEQCSPRLQSAVEQIASQIEARSFERSDFLYAGRLWDLDSETYLQLLDESEYAAWLSAHGFGANHFTVNVNKLNGFNNLASLNEVLRQSGFSINALGGDVKGSPSVYLEQSSTMADKVSVTFSDKIMMLPGGFYEFAKRYPMADGHLFQGFVEASADKIFESTRK